MIDEDRTMQLFGYTSDMLKPKSNKKIIRICEECGKVNEIRFWSYNQAKYSDLCISCSKRGKKSPKYKHKIIKICEICGDKFSVFPANKNQKFCSKKCMGKWQSKNAIGNKSHNWKGGDITLICQQCSNDFKVTSTRKDRSKFCSKKCKAKWESENLIGDKSSNWQGGLTNQKYCKLWTKSFRKIIRDRYHNKCYLCNTTKENNLNRKLSVHHVNYNKNCLCGSSCEFVPLCMKCHTKTNTNRQYWEDLIMCYLYPNRYFMVEI